MQRATLVQCTDSKRSSESKARDFYDESTLFVKMREYAELNQGDWFILSAKHGLVSPDEILEPYDEFGLSEVQATEIARELAANGYDVVEVLAGVAYVDPLVPELERNGIDVINNLSGKRIGERMSWLNQRIKEQSNHTL